MGKYLVNQAPNPSLGHPPMLSYPEIDPVIFRIGPIALRWYGLMYLFGFLASRFLVRKQLRETDPAGAPALYATLDALIVWLVVGVVVGGRLGYVIFYGWGYYVHHPAEIFATWTGGMSFHGGVAGAILAGTFFCRVHQEDFWLWADRFAITAPVGLGLGRIGNFINGELYGRPSDVPWAMIFPQGGLVPRHPSQLYEAALEGVVLFSLLWPMRKRTWASGKKFALFLILYALARSSAEIFREPDAQLGFIAFGWLTMGQVLSFALLLAGIGIWFWKGNHPVPLVRRSIK